MNSQTFSLHVGKGNLLLAAVLLSAALLISLGARLGGLETWVYDSFQRYQYQSASDQILLITVDPADTELPDIWSAKGFSDLVRELDALGANVVAATQPLRLPDLPPVEQINALIELERQASRSDSISGELRRLAAQLAGFRKNYDAQQMLTRQLEKTNSVVLSVQVPAFNAGNALHTECAAHNINLQGADIDSGIKSRLARQLNAPPGQVCAASRGLGVSGFWPDADGVLRRTNLLINANGVLLPSLPLAVLAASGGSNQDIVLASSKALTLKDRIFRTGPGFQVLSRFYANNKREHGFASVSAADVLAGRADPAMVAGRIVLVGDATSDRTPTMGTPIENEMSQLLVTATALSNLIEDDYLLRPAWLPMLEYGLLFAVLLGVLLWLPSMPAIGAALVGLVLATIVLSIEAWFLVSERIWVQFGTASLYAACAVWVASSARSKLASHPTARPRQPSRLRPVESACARDELDLEFSVLRQQPVTDHTKAKMYQIAFLHGRAEEFAKAERVLRYIARYDPDYKDVSALLEKLSGQQQQYTPLQQTLKAAPAPAPAAETEGRFLGRYKIERKIGAGAMAIVYLGTDPKIGRKVAIKTVALAQEFDAAKLEDAQQQFMREAESAGRLNHPNIISIYDAGEDDDISYLAMEYFEGISLLKHAQPDDLLPVSWVLELMARAADALDYAHRQNVVHRDIKPANLMYDAATDELKITDFGIARLTDTSRTKTGIILGTPSYMSPEQLTGSNVTGQSDLYSLGITMYQLLTGVAPFRADSIPKLMDMIMRAEHRPICEVRESLPGCVDSVISTALAKEAEDRYTSGRAMAMALRECAQQIGSKT